MRINKQNKLKAVMISLVIVICVLFPAIGYISNVVKFTQCDFQAPYKAEVIRGVGLVVIPLGVITGYLSIDDTQKH